MLTKDLRVYIRQVYHTEWHQHSNTSWSWSAKTKDKRARAWRETLCLHSIINKISRFTSGTCRHKDGRTSHGNCKRISVICWGHKSPCVHRAPWDQDTKHRGLSSKEFPPRKLEWILLTTWWHFGCLQRQASPRMFIPDSSLPRPFS